MKYAELTKKHKNWRIHAVYDRDSMPAIAPPIYVIDITEIDPVPAQGQFVDFNHKNGTWTTIQDEPFVPFPKKHLGNRGFIELMLQVGVSKQSIANLMSATNVDILLVAEGLKSNLTYLLDDVLMQDALDSAVSEGILTQGQRELIESNWPDKT